MKKTLMILTAAVLALCLCGTAAAEGTVYRIGICQLVQHVALDAATQGFQDALAEKLGDAVTFDVQNASGDSNTCSTIVNGFVSDNVNLIMANATPALQAAFAATGDIPILGTSVTDYATALDISDWTGATGINVSGTSDLAPLDQQAAMLRELFPDAVKVGILYCSAEPNSKYQADVIKGYLEALGCECTDYTFADSNDVASVAQNACDGSDVIHPVHQLLRPGLRHGPDGLRDPGGRRGRLRHGSALCSERDQGIQRGAVRRAGDRRARRIRRDRVIRRF